MSDSSARSSVDMSAQQWRDLRNKIDSILLSGTSLKADEVRKACRQLDDMPADQRSEFIVQKWGPICYDKVEPLLLQLHFLEQQMERKPS